MLLALRDCGGYLLLLLSCAWDLLVRSIFPDQHAEGEIFNRLHRLGTLRSFAAKAETPLQTAWFSFMGIMNDLVAACTASAELSPAVDIVAKVVRVYSRHILQLPREIHPPISAETTTLKLSLEDEDMWGFHVDHDTEVKRIPLLDLSLEEFDDKSCEKNAVSLDLLLQWEQGEMQSSCEPGGSRSSCEIFSESEVVRWI